MLRLIPIILLFFAGPVFAYSPAAKVVEVVSVKKGKIQQKIRLFGTVKSNQEFTQHAESTGILVSALPAGSVVRKGTVIAKLDNPEMQETYKLAVTAEKMANSQHQRLQKLKNRQVTSQKTLEVALAELIAAQQKMLAAKIDFRKTQFVTPFDGIVGVFKAREGMFIKVDQEIVTVYNPNDLIVEFGVPEAYLAKISRGQEVCVQEKHYTLSEVQPIVDPETHMALAFVHLGRADCVIGSIVDVDVAVQTYDDSLYVPHDAVFIEDLKPHVYVVKDNKAHLRGVQVGIQDKGKVQILKGVQPGEVIVACATTRLWDQAEIQVHKESK